MEEVDHVVGVRHGHMKEQLVVQAQHDLSLEWP